MTSISESEMNEFIQKVDYFIINCSKKLMYYHADELKEYDMDVNVWVSITLMEYFEYADSLPYTYTNFIEPKFINDDIIKRMNNEMNDGIEDYSFKSTFFRYCHFYAKKKIYDRLVSMTREYIQELLSYSDDEEDEEDEEE